MRMRVCHVSCCRNERHDSCEASNNSPLRDELGDSVGHIRLALSALHEFEDPAVAFFGAELPAQDAIFGEVHAGWSRHKSVRHLPRHCMDDMVCSRARREIVSDDPEPPCLPALTCL